MDFVERYLQTVAFWLPAEQRDDIIAELREDIGSQIEEREALMNRPLTNLELEELLKRRGSPISVAQRYFPQRYLIGPMLFPIYTRVLKIALAGFAVPALVLWLCALLLSPAGHPNIAKFDPLSFLWTVLWSFFIAVTVIFALLERLQEKIGPLDQWNPKKWRPVRDLRQVPRLQSGSDLAGALIFIAWWRGWVHIPEIPGFQLSYGPIWHAFYWPITAFVFASGILAGFQLVRPLWTRRRAAARLALNIAAAGMACALALFHPWVAIVAPALAPNAIAAIETSINGVLAGTLALAVSRMCCAAFRTCGVCADRSPSGTGPSLFLPDLDRRGAIRFSQLEDDLWALGAVTFAKMFEDQSEEVRPGLIRAHTLVTFGKRFDNLFLQYKHPALRRFHPGANNPKFQPASISFWKSMRSIPSLARTDSAA